ncbi:unnamed protein product [Phytophthora lilii]|uniref:Unnamed protein product n=1 Tax=Phytophthora lilii TaxID=2077276 RepID=A0A9W6XFI6_9STRA|nr:unnamed protein product [Phytophthora lilii]
MSFFFHSLSRLFYSKLYVRIGSQQCFDISHDYDFHQFANEVSKIASINGDLTPELVNGLLEYQTWSLTNRVLIADVSRLTKRDIPQAIQIQGNKHDCIGCERTRADIRSLDRGILDFTTA